MALLPSTVSRLQRQPASVVIKVGIDKNEIADLYPLLRSVEITAGRDAAAIGQMVFEARRDETGAWAVIDRNLFTPWRKVLVEVDFGSYREEVFRGYVRKAAAKYPPNGGEATFEIELQDESLAFDREHLREVWGEETPQSDKEVLETLARRYGGLSVISNGHEGLASRKISQDATAIRFMRDRAKALGYELLFQNGEIYFGPPRLDGEPQPAIMVYAGKSTNCLSFDISEDAMKPDAVRYDLAPREAGADPETDTAKPDLRALGKTRASREGEGLEPYVWRLSRSGDETPEETRARAQALANANEMKVRAVGELDGSLYGHVLWIGRTVKVDGTGGRYDGLYYVDKVAHRLDVKGYVQRFELMRNATGNIETAAGSPGQTASAIGGLFR
jgi:phage protein D